MLNLSVTMAINLPSVPWCLLLAQLLRVGHLRTAICTVDPSDETGNRAPKEKHQIVPQRTTDLFEILSTHYGFFL